MQIRFEWNDEKAEGNLRKHGVSFRIATGVFFDPFAIMEQDRVENGEYRWRTLGMVAGSHLLIVAHAPREEEGAEVIRIISARRADRKERKRYEWENR